MIPKKIHYCWFGGNPLLELAQKCINSWKKYCPDYEIIQWNEANFDISAAPLFVRQAYEAKKWAFITDYVRLYAMTTYGGIYMDTDVQVVRSLDRFLEHRAFSGFEDETHIPTGIMACEKGFPLFLELMCYYDTASLYDADGNLSLVTNVLIITDLLKTKGLTLNNCFQEIEGFALYPKDYFCPKSYQDGRIYKTKNTCTIHHFNGSWHTKEQAERKNARWKEERRRQRKHLPFAVVRKLLGESRYENIRAKLKGR